MYKYLLGFLAVAIIGGASYIYATDSVVEIQQKRVIFNNQDYFLGSDGYYKVGEGIKQEKEVQVAEDKLDRISSQLDILIRLFSGGKLEPVPTPTPVPQPTPEPVPQPVPQPVPTLDKVTADAHSILKTKCFNCHKVNGASEFKIFDKDGNVHVTLPQVVDIHYRTEGLGFEPGTVLMPKGGQPLTTDEMVTLKKWLKLEADAAN